MILWDCSCLWLWSFWEQHHASKSWKLLKSTICISSKLTPTTKWPIFSYTRQLCLCRWFCSSVPCFRSLCLTFIGISRTTLRSQLCYWRFYFCLRWCSIQPKCSTGYLDSKFWKSCGKFWSRLLGWSNLDIFSWLMWSLLRNWCSVTHVLWFVSTALAISKMLTLSHAHGKKKRTMRGLFCPIGGVSGSVFTDTTMIEATRINSGMLVNISARFCRVF